MTNHASNNKTGILIVIIGLFIPLIMYPFTSSRPDIWQVESFFINRGVQYEAKLAELEVVFAQGKSIKEEGEEKGGRHYEGRLAIPYNYLLAIGIMVVFAGLSIIVLSIKRNV